MPLQKIRAAALFTGPLPNLIHNLKYKNAFALATPLAELMLEAWPCWQMKSDLVLPIPLHAERERERGYNQSALLVRACADELGWRWDTKGLRRTRITRPQVDLKAHERRKNVQDAFTAEAQRVRGKRILLVDDVCTTGATLAAAADALLAAGAVSVSAYCLARAK